MPPDSHSHTPARRTGLPMALLDGIPREWRSPLVAWLCGSLMLGAITAREWAEMVHQWWNIDTYNHILLVPLIAVWLIWLKNPELARVTPRAWNWGLAAIAAGLALWLAGRLSGINLFAHAGAVGAMLAGVVSVLGLRVSVLIALPLCYLAFLVPFGDEIIPFLQSITAEIAIALTRWSGIPAMIDGIHIDTPVGLFIVAEECSGVKFLIAMVTLAVLICFTRFLSWRRRAMFMFAAIIVPVLANGVRAWGTIYIAQFAGVEFAAGFDHIFYGWIFFAIVVAVLLGGAWPFFEIEPEDYGYSADQLAQQDWIRRYETAGQSQTGVLGGMAALASIAGVAWLVLAPVAAG